MGVDEIQLPTDFSVITDDQLTELDQVAREAAVPLAERATTDEFSDDDLGTLERLAQVVRGVAEEKGRRVADAASKTARTSRTARAAGVFAAGSQQPADAVEPTGVAAIAAASTGAIDTTIRTGDTPSYTTLVAAVPVVSLNLPAGGRIEGASQIGVVLEASMSNYGGLGPNVYQKNPCIQIRRDYPPELRITQNDDEERTWQKLDHAASPSRLSGGALTAAAGWCAPSQIDYGLFEIENGVDGMYDTPEAQISRGGIQFTPGPDFSTIWGASPTNPVWPQGYWHQTETQVQAARVKPTMVVPCPSFTNVRLEVEGVQITGAFLQDRGYPELVSRFARGALVVHKRRMNAFKLNVVTDGSTLIDLTGANWPATTVESKDLTTISRLLSAYGIQAMDYRYRYRMGLTDTLEAVLPYWVLEYVRADIQRRMLVTPDEAFAVALDQVVSWFAVRNIRLQFVYDWQDAFNAPLGAAGILEWSNSVDNTARFTVDTKTNVGSAATQIYTLPTTVFGLLYAPGTWVNGVSDVIRLDTVFDSTNLALNQYVNLFFEEGTLMAKRGYESRLLKLSIEPSGTVSASSSMTV